MTTQNANKLCAKKAVRSMVKLITSLLLLTITATLSYAETIDGPANIRHSPKGKVLFSLNNGVQILLVAAEGDWYQIRVNALFDKIALSKEGKIQKGTTLYDDKGTEIGRSLDDIFIKIQTETNEKLSALFEGYTHKKNIAEHPEKKRNPTDEIAKRLEQAFAHQADFPENEAKYINNLCFGIEELGYADQELKHFRFMLKLIKEDKHPAVRLCSIKYFERAKSEKTEKALSAHRNEIIQTLTPYLRDDNKDISYQTAKQLLVMGEATTALPVLEDFAKQERLDIYFISHTMPGTSWEQQGIELIRKASSSRNIEVRANALLHLIRLKNEGKISDNLDALKKQTINATEEILIKPKWDTVPKYSDMRALGALMSAISTLGDVKLIPLLQRIAKHPDASYLQRDAESTIISIQLENCIEPVITRKKPNQGKVYYMESKTTSNINSRISPIGYLSLGLASGFESIMESLGLTARIIKSTQITSTLAKEVPYLIVPESAFSSPYFAESIYENLKNYARSGGTLVVFAQDYGMMYSKLMDGVEAIGCNETRAFKNEEMIINAEHHMFPGFPKRSLFIATHGYFKKLPTNTRTLLKADKSNLPIFIEYPLGKGRVFASTIFSPVAFFEGYATEDEIVFFREMINYFEASLTLPEVRQGQTIRHKLKIKNENGKRKATKAVIMIYDPERAIMRYRKEFPVDLKPGASSHIKFEYPTCPTAALGTWHVKYELMTEGYQLLTSELDPEGTNVWLEMMLQAPKYAVDGRFIVTK